MISNFFKTALRSLTREKTYTIVNVAGLTLGIFSSILIGLWASFEMSYDDIYQDKDRIFRVYQSVRFKDDINTGDHSTARIADVLHTFPAVEKVGIAIRATESTSLLTNELKAVHRIGYSATQEYLDIFRFPLSAGNLASAFNDPYSIVITESTARALFQGGEALHQMILFEDSVEVKVTAIVKDLPRNSSIQFDFLVPVKLLQIISSDTQECMNTWQCDRTIDVFVQTHPLSDHKELGEMLTQKTIALINAERANGTTDFFWYPMEQWEFFLYPMERWHLHGRFKDGIESSDDKMELVRNMLLLAALIIIVACINFTNLSTARSFKRSREVGIRKASGSSRRQLIAQFLGESIMWAAVAFFVAITLAQLALPLFNLWLDIQVQIDFSSLSFWLAAAALIVFVGCLAGSYPALYLSSFSPANVLRTKTNISGDNILLRRFLVALQFGISSCLVIATIILKKQIDIGLTRDTGFDKAKLITIRDNEELSAKYEVIKQKLLASGAVESMVKTSSPVSDIYHVNYINWEGNPGPPVTSTHVSTDYGYFRTTGVRLVEGRDFSPDISSDTFAIICNQALIDVMALDDPLGKQVFIGPDKLTIIGIAEDVVMGNPFGKVPPLHMVHLGTWDTPDRYPYITLRLADITQLDKVQQIIKSIVIKHPFEFSFVDQDYEHKFNRLVFLRNMTNCFAVLAITIACLGLLGLAAYTAEQRQRELCIRKIHGASVVKLVKLVLTDFVKLTVVSYLLFAPFGIFLINRYMERYEQRAFLAWPEFVMTGIGIVLTAICIVSVQVIRASTRNPAEVLKVE